MLILNSHNEASFALGWWSFNRCAAPSYCSAFMTKWACRFLDWDAESSTVWGRKIKRPGIISFIIGLHGYSKMSDVWWLAINKQTFRCVYKTHCISGSLLRCVHRALSWRRWKVSPTLLTCCCWFLFQFYEILFANDPMNNPHTDN